MDKLIGVNKWGTYLIPPGCEHRPAVQAIIKGEVWEPKTVAFIQRHAPPGKDIIHAGVFFGDMVPALASALADEALLWGFEPNDVSYDHVLMTVLANQLEDKVRLARVALSDAAGNGKLQVRKHGQELGGLSHVVVGSEDEGTQPISFETLDALIPSERNVGMIHFDLEGFENQATMGSFRIIKRDKPVLVLETVVDATRRVLHGLGYKQVWEAESNSVFKYVL